jgi:hypothetical protein
MRMPMTMMMTIETMSTTTTTTTTNNNHHHHLTSSMNHCNSFTLHYRPCLIPFSLFLIFPMAASAVGRCVGTSALAAFSLGGLHGHFDLLVYLGRRALMAADTLMPRALGVEKVSRIGYCMLAVRGTVAGVVMLLIPDYVFTFLRE